MVIDDQDSVALWEGRTWCNEEEESVMGQSKMGDFGQSKTATREFVFLQAWPGWSLNASKSISLYFTSCGLRLSVLRAKENQSISNVPYYLSRKTEKIHAHV